MIRVARDFKPLLDQLSGAFSRPETARCLILFFTATIVVVGDRTVSTVIRLLALIEPLNPSTYHRLFSHRRWSARRPARIIARFVVDRFCPEGVVKLVGDETVDGHRGKKVYGKARHRDAVRSSLSHTVYRYGHKWVVLAVLVELPYANRPIALPVLVALYRDRKTNVAERRVHKTPAELMCGLLAMLIHFFPERKFVFAGDNAYGSHAMARFAYRHRSRLTLVSKIVPDANLFEPPPKRRDKAVGRPSVKGKSLPAPCEVVAAKKRGKKLQVRWYGGGWRNVEVITDTGGWFKSGKGLVPIRWVYVRDLDGTHRDEYFFTTDTSMSAEEVIEMYGGRWNIETTFQELRAHLGLETTRGWHRQTVLRMALSLFLLYTIVVVFYDTTPQSSSHLRTRSWLGKGNRSRPSAINESVGRKSGPSGFIVDSTPPRDFLKAWRWCPQRSLCVNQNAGDRQGLPPARETLRRTPTAISLAGCVPAEPTYVSRGRLTLANPSCSYKSFGHHRYACKNPPSPAYPR